jgi:UDP-glucose 4-epimerase
LATGYWLLALFITIYAASDSGGMEIKINQNQEGEKMGKILITGAAGFIGSQLAYRLGKEQADLVLVDNFSYGKEDNLVFADRDFRAEVLRIDIRDATKIDELIANSHIEMIYHIAGIAPLPDCQLNPAEAVQVNVVGTVNILEASRKFGVEKVIFASTGAIYENDLVFPSVEDRFELPSLIYPNTKYAAERFCESYCRTYGLSVSCLRFANVYGPHIDCLRKQPPFIGYMIRELYYDRIPTFYSDGKQSRDYIYVDDLIDLALKARTGSGFECLNVASGWSYSVKELYDLTARLMGKESIRPYFEKPQKYWDKYPELYQGQYGVKKTVLEHEVNKFTQCSNRLALEKYGWRPRTTIESGLQKSIEFATGMLAKQARLGG